MFAQMTIGKKLMTGFSALLVCLLGLSYFSLSAVGSLSGDLDQMANRTAREVDLSGTINGTTAGMRAESRALILAAALKNTGDLEKARSGFGNLSTLMDQTIREIRLCVIPSVARKPWTKWNPACRRGKRLSRKWPGCAPRDNSNKPTRFGKTSSAQ
jgi:hypothetical protein